MITKVLLSAAITLGAALAIAAPANADPSAFGVLSCSCEQAQTVPASDDLGVPPDPVDQGIQNGIAELTDFRSGVES